MSQAVLDDHLLRSLLADEVDRPLARVLADREVATTNLFYVRLCRSAVAGSGGKLTGAWPAERRRALARALVALPATIRIVPMCDLAFRMAELADSHRLSSLGAEAVAAAEYLDAPLYVWAGDDGPNIRAAAKSVRVAYRTLR